MVCGGGGGGVRGCFGRRGCDWGCISGGCESGGCNLLELNFVFLSEVASQFSQVDWGLPSIVSFGLGLDLRWLRRFSPRGGCPVSPRGGVVLGLGARVVNSHGFPEDSLVILGQGNVSWSVTRRVSVSPRGVVSPQGGNVLGVVVGLGRIVGNKLQVEFALVTCNSEL